MSPRLRAALWRNIIDFPEPLPKPHPLVRAAVLGALFALVALGTWGLLRMTEGA